MIKVVELVGASPLSFEHAIQTAVSKAAKTLRHISGVDVRHAIAEVTDGRIREHRVDLKVAFAIDDEDDD